MMRRGVLLALIVASCDGPPRRPPPPVTGANVVLRGWRVYVEWLREDPDRRCPISERAALPMNRGILTGYAHARNPHYFPYETDASFDVAFLGDREEVVDIQRLTGADERGVTARMPARYALFLAPGWLAGHGVVAGDRVEFSAEITAHPPAPMPEIKVGGVAVRVETAHRYRERIRGLQHRRAMAAEDGMLFVYASEDDRSYWMKHCHMGLDISYFDAAGGFLNVVTMDPYPNPAVDEQPSAPSAGPARFVLEVNKGWFRRHGLVGDDGRPTRDLRLELPESILKMSEQAD